MKKQLLTLSLALSSSLIMNAQSNQKWSQNGDNVTESTFIGTTNNQDFTLKANNNVGIKIKPNGEVVFKSLDLNSSTGPNGLMLTNGQGKMYRLNFPNDATKVLLGNGTFGNFPTGGQWQTSGNNLFYNNGNVAIGAEPSGSFKLVVGGDARVANDLFVNHDLFVGGGVIISDKIQGVTEVKGWDFKVENKLDVIGSTRFSGTTQLDQGFTFDGSKGIKFTPGQDNGGIFRYGINGDNQVLGTPCAAGPNASYMAHQFAGILQVFDPLDPNTGLLNLQTWTGGSSIDASKNAENDPAALLLNFFCGNDVAICTGQYGGHVAMGKEVSIGGAWPRTPSTALDIRANGTKGLSIQNVNAIEVFSVMNDGKTHIGTQKPTLTASHANALLSVGGDVVAKAVYVTQQNWADFVFDPNYKLMPWKDLENYFVANKHLPNVPTTKEITAEGNDLAQTDAVLLQKIEESYLYMAEIMKQMEELKKKNIELQKQLEELKK